MVKQKNKKNFLGKKSLISGDFFIKLIFLKNICEIPLDFSEVYAHTKRAFKLRHQNKKETQPLKFGGL